MAPVKLSKGYRGTIVLLVCGIVVATLHMFTDKQGLVIEKDSDGQLVQSQNIQSQGVQNQRVQTQSAQTPSVQSHDVQNQSVQNQSDQRIKFSKFPQLSITENYTGVPCKHTLDLPQSEILEKVSSYSFPGIEHYIEDLFPGSFNVMPKDPVFVTAFSSNHLEEGIAMIYNFFTQLNKRKNKKLFVYDIGLKPDEVAIVEEECECKVERFEFENYPDHVRILKPCAWKPIIIQLVAKKHPFVVWMDASVRFVTNNLALMIKTAKRRGVMGNRGKGSIAAQTSIETFQFLNEPPCLYRGHEIESNFVIVYQTPFITKYFMKPWVSCALSRGCLTPFNNVDTIMNCAGKRHYFHCHREQSILGILVNRLFHKEVEDHSFVNGEHYIICRGCLKKGDLSRTKPKKNQNIARRQQFDLSKFNVADDNFN